MELRHSPARALRTVFLAGAAFLALSAAFARTEAKTDFALVTPQWVAAHANDPGVRILDVRPDVHDYLAAHVPNAIHVADSSFRAPSRGLPVQYLSASATATLLGGCGIRPNDTVVVYSDGPNVLGASMVAYVLERMGHPSVRILDGGFSAFKATEQTTQALAPAPQGRVPAVNLRSTHVTLAQVKQALGNPNVILIDSRPEADYLGQTATWQRGGHIPGAINIDWHSVVDENNPHQFRPAEQLRAMYAARGVTRDKDIILYCGTGCEATLQYQALKYMLGYPKVRLFEGSWTEYSAQPDLRVETTATLVSDR